MLTASLSEFLEHHSVPICEFHFIKGSFSGPLVYLATLSLKAHLSVLTNIHTFVLSIVMLHQVNLGFSNLSTPVQTVRAGNQNNFLSKPLLKQKLFHEVRTMKQGEMMKLPIFIGRRMDARIYFIIHSHQPLIKSHVRQPRHPPACLLMWHHEEERYEKPYLDLYFDRKAERKLESSEKARFTSKQEMFQGGFKLNSALLQTSFFPIQTATCRLGNSIMYQKLQFL